MRTIALAALSPFLLGNSQCSFHAKDKDESWEASTNFSGSSFSSTTSGSTVSGAAVVGALVEARDADGREVALAVSRADGRYTMTLPAGRYRFRATGGWLDLDHDRVRDPGEPDNDATFTGVGTGAVNLSPFTTVIVARAEELAGTSDVDEVWRRLAEANDEIAASVGLEGIDLHTVVFDADGTGIDAVHDRYALAPGPGSPRLIERSPLRTP
jgi:hypothetical protein